MGKKKKRKKLAEKVNAYIEDNDLDPQELIAAGIGVLSQSIKKGKSKGFAKAIKRGRRVASHNLTAVAEMLDPDLGLSAPVVAYRSTGGGWYDIDVDGTIVEQVQGEEEAAERAGQLLAGFAALDPEDQELTHTALTHVGGGWYDIVVNGVPIDKIQGKEEAEDRFAEIQRLNADTQAA